MYHRNPLQFNDWDIRSFAIIMMATLFSFLGLVMAVELGIIIPIVTPLVTSAFITFVPGYAALKALRIHERGNIVTPLLAAGLSILFVMLIGLALNLILPVLNYWAPIGRVPFSMALVLVTAGLTGLAWWRDWDWTRPGYFEPKDLLRPGVLAPILLPLLAVFGALVMNWYGANQILLLLLFIVGAIAVLAAFDVISPRNMPLVVLSVSSALLLHKSLITSYISGWDIQHEYWIATQVLSDNYWAIALPYHTNSMMSITILAPAYSLFSGMDLVWVFKIVFPLIYSLMPLALFYLFRELAGNKVAFLSVFFFMAFFVFYGEMLALARQQIAELFLALILLLIVDPQSSGRKYHLLFLLFSVGMITSHYGLSYLFMLILIMGAAIQLIERILANRNGIHWLLSKLLPWLRQAWRPNSKHLISGCYVLFFVGFTVLWSIIFSNSSIFLAVVDISQNIIGSLNNMFNPTSAQGLHYLVAETNSMLSEILKWAQIAAILLITISIIHMMRKREKRWNDEYVALSLAAFVVCVMALAFPYFASSLNSTRIYHAALIFLSPFCISGALLLVHPLSRMLNVERASLEIGTLKILGIFFALFLLLNSGVVHEMTGDHSISISLDKLEDGQIYTDADVAGGLWLDRHIDANTTAYVDHNRWPLLNGIDWWRYTELPNNIAELMVLSIQHWGDTEQPGHDGTGTSRGLLFLAEYNVRSQTVLSSTFDGSIITIGYHDLSPFLIWSECLYTSGTTQVRQFA